MTDIVDDKILISQLHNNNAEAFDALFHKYSNKLFRFSFSLLKNEEDSKEIVQEVFFRLWNERYQLDSSKSVKSFLFTISYHIIIDHLRLRLKDKNYRKSLERYFSGTHFEQNNTMDCDILKIEINKAVELLPEKRKTIYRMSRENGLSYKKIASLLNIKEKTVENQINLALKHIKSFLGKDFLPFMFLLLYLL